MSSNTFTICLRIMLTACLKSNGDKKDLVIRITDWTKDKHEPAYDVECYIGGIYDWNKSKSFTLHQHKTKAEAKKLAVVFAQKAIASLL